MIEQIKKYGNYYVLIRMVDFYRLDHKCIYMVQNEYLMMAGHLLETVKLCSMTPPLKMLSYQIITCLAIY